MNKRPSMQRISELQQFVADFARVVRVPHLANTGRPENDVEHSYGLALTCWFLAPKIAPDLDLLKIFMYALAHDTVEIHAGDTFTFGPAEHIATKPAREDKALEQLRKEWPDFSELVDMAAGYKEKRDEEAKFVYAVDKLLPVIMVNLGEKDSYWAKHKITLQMQMDEKRDKVRVSPPVAPYYEELVEWMTNPDYFYKPKADQ